MNTDARIYVAGHRGLVGGALCRALRAQGFENIITAPSEECDLRQKNRVMDLFDAERPEYVFLCAAKVGGIIHNSTYPVDFMQDNLAIQGNVMDAAHKFDVRKLLFTGSACAYPKYAPNPIRESDLLGGVLEESNECYALAKICGIKLCQAYRKQHGCNFIACMPTNLYGPGDHYDLNNSHVIPGMIRRMHEAVLAGDVSMKLWGSGMPTREFLYCDDLANALLFLMDRYNSPELINVGTGHVYSLSRVAEDLREIVGYSGLIVWDHTKPDGTPKRQMDSTKLFGMGWSPRIDLPTGLALTYKDFVNTCAHS